MTKPTSAKSKKVKPLPHVLLVEDDAILAMGLEDAFRAAGTENVTICQTMKATMQALSDGPKPDGIVLDVHLADRDDGWAIAELVTFLGTRPPRIAFSTGSPEDIPASVAKLGMVFEKPYNVEELVECMMAGRKKGPLARLIG